MPIMHQKTFQEQCQEINNQFIENLVMSQQNLELDIQEVVNDIYWELLDDNSEKKE